MRAKFITLTKRMPTAAPSRAVASTATAAALRWTAIAALLFVGLQTVWRVREAKELSRCSDALQRPLEAPRLRLLIVGDSTAVGTGASSRHGSVAGLLAQAFPHLLIDNRARNGATLDQVLRQLEGDERFDMVLVQAGGNDVIRLRGLAAMRFDIDRVTRRALERAQTAVLMPPGNVGNAPFFMAPVSWLMTWRSRRLHALVDSAAAANGAVYVKLFHERDDDPFVQRPALNAADGLHASDAGYRVWFAELMLQANLLKRLAAARVDHPVAVLDTARRAAGSRSR